MKHLYYCYKSLSGKKIPDVFPYDSPKRYALMDLKLAFKHSSTPIIKIFKTETLQEKKDLLLSFVKQFHKTSKREIGLHYNLEFVIEELMEEIKTFS